MVPSASRSERSRTNDVRRSTESGWWMVVTTGRPERADPEQAPAEALHVVHDVPALAGVEPRRDAAQRAQAEREGLGQEAEPGGAEAPRS